MSHLSWLLKPRNWEIEYEAAAKHELDKVLKVDTEEPWRRRSFIFMLSLCIVTFIRLRETRPTLKKPSYQAAKANDTELCLNMLAEESLHL